MILRKSCWLLEIGDRMLRLNLVKYSGLQPVLFWETFDCMRLPDFGLP